MGKFLTKLDVEQVEDTGEEGRGTWKVLSPLQYQADSGVIYCVPEGFITDFATVPRIPFVFDTLGDRGNLAATLHDWLYTPGPVTKLCPIATRLMADSLLREALVAQGCSKFTALLFFIGVRVSGASHWG